MKRIFFVVFLFVSLLKCQNLHELIDLSLENESYIQKQLNFLRSLSEEDSVKYAYFPTLNLNGAYVASNKDRVIIEPQEILMSSISLKFLLFDGGDREAKIASMKTLSTLAKLQKDQSANILAFNAVTLYFNYLSLEKITQSSQQKRMNLKYQQERLLSFYKAGLASESELESINAQYELSIYEEKQNETKLYELKNALYNLSKMHFTPSKSHHIKEPTNEKNNSYEIALALEKTKIEDLKINSVKSDFYPKIFLQNSFSFYDINYNSKLPLGGEFLEKYSQNNRFILAFEWKIFDFNSNHKALEAQKYASKMAQLELEKTKRTNNLELDSLSEEIKLFKIKINALNASLKAAKIAYETIEKKYNAGLCSYVEYLNALDLKYQTNAKLELAKNDYEIKKAKYYLQAGIDIKTKVSQ